MDKKQEYIYVILVKALTGLGKLGRKINKYEYTHIAVSLDEQLRDFVTFSRRLHCAPFDAGFMHEKVEHYAFGTHKKVKIKIFKVPVSDMEKIKAYIQKIEKDKEYLFNIYSMITMFVLHGFRIYKAHNCMSFVGKILELTETVKLDRRYYKYNIEEMDLLLTPYFYKETEMEKDSSDADYMQKVGVWKNLKLFMVLNGKLIYRMLFQRGKTEE